MENLITTLMIWIGAHTAYDTSAIVHPEVRLLTPKEMTEEYYRDTGATLPDSGIDSRIFALYNSEDAENGIVFLLDPRLNSELSAESIDIPRKASWQRTEPLHQDWLENPVFQEQLLHELIHHVQYQSGAKEQFPCPAHAEKEAYLLGGKYLSLRHVTDPLPNRKILAYMFSRC